jgi:hypothetical protein
MVMWMQPIRKMGYIHMTTQALQAQAAATNQHTSAHRKVPCSCVAHSHFNEEGLAGFVAGSVTADCGGGALWSCGRSPSGMIGYVHMTTEAPQPLSAVTNSNLQQAPRLCKHC